MTKVLKGLVIILVILGLTSCGGTKEELDEIRVVENQKLVFKQFNDYPDLTNYFEITLKDGRELYISEDMIDTDLEMDTVGDYIVTIYLLDDDNAIITSESITISVISYIDYYKSLFDLFGDSEGIIDKKIELIEIAPYFEEVELQYKLSITEDRVIINTKNSFSSIEIVLNELLLPASVSVEYYSQTERTYLSAIDTNVHFYDMETNLDLFGIIQPESTTTWDDIADIIEPHVDIAIYQFYILMAEYDSITNETYTEVEVNELPSINISNIDINQNTIEFDFFHNADSINWTNEGNELLNASNLNMYLYSTFTNQITKINVEDFNFEIDNLTPDTKHILIFTMDSYGSNEEFIDEFYLGNYEFTTQKYDLPTISIFNIEIDYDSMEYQYEINDPYNLTISDSTSYGMGSNGFFGDPILTNEGNFVTIENMPSQQTYDIHVCVDYDMGGDSEVDYICESIVLTTLKKEIPVISYNVSNNEISSTINVELGISLGEESIVNDSMQLKVYYEDTLIDSILVTDYSQESYEFNDLDPAKTYKVILEYTFDLNTEYYEIETITMEIIIEPK